MQPLQSELRITSQTDIQQVASEINQTSFISLFRFTKPFDILLMLTGSIAACIIGASLPLFCLFYGNMINIFTNPDTMVDQAKKILLDFIYMGIAALTGGWLTTLCWTVIGERQSTQCRKEYFKSLLSQELAWFDTHDQSEMAIQFSVNTHIYRSVLSQKIPILINILSMFVTSLIIAFLKGWLLTLVVLFSMPFVIFSWYLFSKTKLIKKDALQKLYEKGGSKVQQVLSCIKVIKQMNGQQHQINSYFNLLTEAIGQTLKYGIYSGLGSGLSFAFLLLSFTLTMWYGSQCVEGTSLCPTNLNGGDTYSPGALITILYGLLLPAMNLSQLTPAIERIIEGKQAAFKIFSLIDRQPAIKSPLYPKQIHNFRGTFIFQNVTFAYPKNKSKIILENVNLQIKSRNTVLIGESGCGKSTIFQLMMRFYDPDQGAITLDGIDLRQLDLQWLRSQIGYVGQEPILFATSIKQNLLLGKSNASEAEIQEALKMAQALNFVNNFQNKLDTYVGTDGNQLSGGQKQRIAIARALLKNPKILLFDEATSALDYHNQKQIQNTLNSISQNCMSITITHHLKAIAKSADVFRVEKRCISEQRWNEICNNSTTKPQRCKTKAMGNEDEKQAEVKIIQKTFKNQIVENVLEEYQSPQKEGIEQIEEAQNDKRIYRRLFGFVERRVLFAVGILLAIFNGVNFPLFSIFMSKMIITLIQYSNESGSSLPNNDFNLIIMVSVAILSFITLIFQEIIFTTIGEDLTLKIRKQTFQKIIKMSVPWFQDQENDNGHIAASLQNDCRIVNSIFTTYMARLIMNISTLIFGISMALFYEWRTALVALGLLPLIIISQAVQMAFSNGMVQSADKSLKQSARLIKEAIDNIRTVKSLANEQLLLQKYSQKFKQILQKSITKGHITGFLFGFSYFVMYLIFSLILYLGAIFIRHSDAQLSDMFIAAFLIIFAGGAAGNNASKMPDLSQARQAALNLFQISDQEDEDQLQIKRGSLNLKTPIKGNITLENVDFKYENRQQLALKNINIDIREGEKVGFVGQSGSGKSTIIQLLLGFYSPTAGRILIDGVNLADYDIHHLRASFGVVSQEPILFNQTIEYNIKYNKQDATKEDIVAAAKQANFNPDEQYFEENQVDQSVARIVGTGFNQNVGLKGTHISGGQKQRVAIARVIVRQPTILLLDEATSALDQNNQRKVQESLDRLMFHKTCINVTHRMQTVKNASQIVVFDQGKVAEVGRYDELSKKEGYFAQLLRHPISNKQR